MGKPGETSPTLQRQVLPPTGRGSGLAVVVAMSMMMFFALATSALVLRSRSCPYKQQPPPRARVEFRAPDTNCKVLRRTEVVPGTVQFVIRQCAH